MRRQIALLRGVNLARRRRIPMAGLRELLSGLGYVDVTTYQQSGNVILTSHADARQLAEQIESAIATAFGMTVPVVVRSRDELARVIETNPFPDAVDDGAKLLVTFLTTPVEPAALAELDPATFRPDQFVAGSREIYLWCPNGLQSSLLSDALANKLGAVVGTTRNWNTVTRLRKLAEGR